MPKPHRSMVRRSLSRRSLLTLGVAALIGTLAACSSVEVRSKPGSGLTRDSRFTLDVVDDVTATRARLTSRLIARGFNVIVTPPGDSAEDSVPDRSALPDDSDSLTITVPNGAPDKDSLAARYVLTIDHAFSQSKRLGMTTTRYTSFAARMVDSSTGQVVLSAVMDGDTKVDATLDNLVVALDRSLL